MRALGLTRPWPRLVVALAAGLSACGGQGPNDPSPPQGRPPGVEAAAPESVTGGVNSARGMEAPYVVLVSIDGFASRYIGQHPAPALEALAAEGIWARDGMIPVYPTKTFPNHYSLATGLYPARHGIVANSFYDPQRDESYRISDRDAVGDGSWYRGEPIWVTAEQQGLVAASFYWVGSEAAVGGVRPSYWRLYDESVPNDARVDQVLTWLGYPAEYRPHLVTLYFSTTDGVGHTYGPDSPQMTEAVASVDASIGRLLQGLEALPFRDRMSVIVLSDHGMDAFDAENTRYLADAVDLEEIFMASFGTSANVFVGEGPGRAEAVRDSANAALSGVTAYLADETPERFHYRGDERVGDVVLMPDSAHLVYPVQDRPATSGYNHGWDNQLLSMRALFVASGGALASGREIEPFEAVDVYPLVARLLGLQPAPGIDGSAATWDGLVGG